MHAVSHTTTMHHLIIPETLQVLYIVDTRLTTGSEGWCTL